MTNPLEKIQALDAIEKDIVLCIQSAGNALQELSKEKPSQKNAENHTNQFLKSLNSIENKLSDQINYLIQVSTTHAHEGSGYSSAKNLQMAWQVRFKNSSEKRFTGCCLKALKHHWMLIKMLFKHR